MVVDRTAVTLTYTPFAGTSTTDFAVSYQFNPQWDLLVSYVSAPAGFSVVRFGGRYHVKPPSPSFDTYLTLQYFSPSTGASYAELGGGLTQTLALGVKSYAVVTYLSGTGGLLPNIRGNLGVQYELSRQFALVTGYDLFNSVGYVGINFDFSAR